MTALAPPVLGRGRRGSRTPIPGGGGSANLRNRTTVEPDGIDAQRLASTTKGWPHRCWRILISPEA
jgi:hypothetical protein